MNLISIISLAIIIVACIVLILLSKSSKRKKENKKLQLLSAITGKHNSSVTQNEFFGDLLIGLDEKSNFLFFINNSQSNKTEQAINLSETQKCRVINTSRAVNNTTVIDKLELCFTPLDKNTPQVSLEFYNSDNSPTLVGELQLIEKWAEIVKSQLNKGCVKVSKLS